MFQEAPDKVISQSMAMSPRSRSLEADTSERQRTHFEHLTQSNFQTVKCITIWNMEMGDVGGHYHIALVRKTPRLITLFPTSLQKGLSHNRTFAKTSVLRFNSPKISLT